jgi:predicted DNA-binding transcriptional regulator AlpA
LFDEFPEILTVIDVAKALQLSRSQVYDLTRCRGQVRHEIPLPVLKIGTNLRFRKSDIIGWLERLAAQDRSVQ